MSNFNSKDWLRPVSAAAFLLFGGKISAQYTNTDSLSALPKLREIEAVRLTKILGNDKNKRNLAVAGSDLLGHDAGKFLSALPEISGIRKSGNYATDPVFRGFKYEQLNIVTDGVAAAVNACPSRMDPGISQVNMNMVREAEIFKGPYQFRYGSAFGATINFVTVPPKFSEKTNFGGRVSMGYEGNGNLGKSEGFGSLSTKKAVLNLFAAYQHGDDYKDGNGDKVPAKFTRYSFGSKFNFKWNNHNISNIQLTTNQGRDIDFPALSMKLLYDKTWLLQAAHRANFDSEHINYLDVSGYFSRVNHSMGNKMMVSDVRSGTYGGRAELSLKFGSDTSIFTGLDYKHEQAENTGMSMTGMMMMPRDGSSWQDSHIEQAGWFAELRQPWQKFAFTLSARLDYNHAAAKDVSRLFATLYPAITATNWNPNLSASLSRELAENSRITLLIGHAQRSASLTERFINRFPVGNDSFEYIGNPGLKPEKNTQADLVFTLRNEKIYFQADGFFSYLQDYISGAVVALKPYSMQAPGTRQFQNLPKAMKTGAEARLSIGLGERCSTEMAAAYTFAKDLATGMPLPEIAPLDLRWKISADFSPLKLGLAYRFSGAQNRISTAFGEMRTPDFSVFDASARWEIFSNASLSLDVLNIFNRAYAEHLSRTLVINKEKRIFAPGRSFNLGFNYNF